MVPSRVALSRVYAGVILFVESVVAWEMMLVGGAIWCA